MIAIALLGLVGSQVVTNLVNNPSFAEADVDGHPIGYTLAGNASWTWTGYTDELTTAGVALSAFGGSHYASVSQMVRVEQRKGRWLSFRFRGMAEDGFKVIGDHVFMKLGFYSKGGTNFIDSAERLIYREIERDRKDLDVNGKDRKGGAAVWRTYAFEELLPFPEVDTVKIEVAFKDGNSEKVELSSFFVDDFSLTQAADSTTGAVDPSTLTGTRPVADAGVDTLVSLGGRWYYRPGPGEQLEIDGKVVRVRVSQANSDRLYYRSAGLTLPFAGCMSSVLRKGFMDLQGAVVTKDRPVEDSVVLEFDGTGSMKMSTKNLPNHATAKFPDTYGTQGYNPSYIQEQRDTYYLPLDPKRNPSAISMTANDENGALPMGAVGVAVNGVIFYNPFDAGMQDATSLMDRCCGHPSPDYRYHYHKYPICVNTSFIDKGEGHSPVIGFAFDGFPVYGPYEAKGVMAKDLKENSLNAFNAHYDVARGWHYHVTPGKFPYIVGGYFGQVDPRNFRRGPR